MWLYLNGRIIYSILLYERWRASIFGIFPSVLWKCETVCSRCNVFGNKWPMRSQEMYSEGDVTTRPAIICIPSTESTMFGTPWMLNMFIYIFRKRSSNHVLHDEEIRKTEYSFLQLDFYITNIYYLPLQSIHHSNSKPRHFYSRELKNTPWTK